MGRYFVRGRSPGGRKTTERVHAPDTTAATAQLRARGYTDVELLSSEFETGAVTDEEELTAAQQAAIPFRGDWYPGWIVVRGSWFLWLPSLLYLIHRAVSSAPVGFYDVAALACVGLVFVCALWAARSTALYTRMLRAHSLGQWETALRRVDALRRSRRYSSQIPPSELDFRSAAALLRLGRESEAEAAVSAARNDGSQPGWLLEARTADYYIARRDRTRARERLEAAVALSPDIAETHLALAEFLAGDLVRDASAARRSLETALRYPVAKSVRWAPTKVEGIILLEEGDPNGALKKLTLARTQFRELADCGLGAVADAHIGAYLCLAYAALGERARAAREFRAAETWLAPHGLDDLLERCRLAIRDG